MTAWFFVCTQPCSTTMFGVPFPLPTPQGAGIGNSVTSLRSRFEGCATEPSGQGVQSANLVRKECQPARVATRLESEAAPPHDSIFRDEGHLPAMVWLTGDYARWNGCMYMNNWIVCLLFGGIKPHFSQTNSCLNRLVHNRNRGQ